MVRGRKLGEEAKEEGEEKGKWKQLLSQATLQDEDSTCIETGMSQFVFWLSVLSSSSLPLFPSSLSLSHKAIYLSLCPNLIRFIVYLSESSMLYYIQKPKYVHLHNPAE